MNASTKIYQDFKTSTYPETLYYDQPISKKMLKIKRKRLRLLKKNSFSMREFRKKAIGDVIKEQNDQ